jgi:hypothetical protein
MGSPGGIINVNIQNQDITNNVLTAPLKNSFKLMNPTMIIIINNYLLSGYYAAGNVKERWVSPIVANNPPSGHLLVDIEVEAFWQVLS